LKHEEILKNVSKDEKEKKNLIEIQANAERW
jgi:hypothetical protein